MINYIVKVGECNFYHLIDGKYELKEEFEGSVIFTNFDEAERFVAVVVREKCKIIKIENFL